MNLKILIEILGKEVAVGEITGSSVNDAVFRYYDEYINSGYLPISISLQFQNEAFSPEQTRRFFDGLLPEGFTRKSVALSIHSDENDYLKILYELGKECLGAIRIADGNISLADNAAYEVLSVEDVKALANEGATKSTELITKAHLSLTGASGKVGLYYDSRNDSWYIPMGSAPSTHIVKQSHVRLMNIVANEQLALLTAKKLGLGIANSFIINTGGVADGDVLLASERYDRIFDKDAPVVSNLPAPFRLHQEDFAQAMGVPASEKYEMPQKKYLHDIMELIQNWSANPVEDQLKLWDKIVFDYLIGNTDNHIKNISLLYSPDMRSIRLAPAYDIVSTVIYESSTKDMAFAINGKYSLPTITREDFKYAAEEAGIGSGIAMRRFDKLASEFKDALQYAAEILKSKGFTMAENISESILQKGGIGCIISTQR